MYRINILSKVLCATVATLALTSSAFATPTQPPMTAPHQASAPSAPCCETKPCCEPAPCCETKPCCEPTPLLPPKPTVPCEPIPCQTCTMSPDPCDPMPCCQPCCEEPSPGPCAFDFPKDLGLCCPRDFYLDAAFLLMQACEDGLEYAMKQSQTETSYNFPLQDGTIYGYTSDDKSAKWNYGLRLAAGIYLSHDRWDVQAAWTYFKIKNDKGTRLNGGVLLPLWLDNTLQSTGNNYSSSARWTASLNTFDIRLGKPYHVSRYLILNPFYGVRFGCISQNYLTRNGGLFTFEQNQADGIDMFAKNDFWGVGTRAGLDSEWHLVSGWYFFGNIAAALLYSHFEVEQSVTFRKEIHSQIDHDFYTVTPNAEIKLGLCWTDRFCCNKYLLRLSAAYEFHAWFDQNRMRKLYHYPASNDNVSRADLYLSGFAFNMGFEF